MALRAEMPARVLDVSRLWMDRPSRTLGPSRVVGKSGDWLIRTDVWKMERLGMQCDSADVLMAISTHRPRALTCLRDLQRNHLDSLVELDTLYPDREWIKFILYPPWVWQLHIHICRRGCDNRLPCRNVHLLGDVISMLGGNGDIQGGCLLVYRF